MIKIDFINYSNVSISNYIPQYTNMINGTKVLRELCQFKYDYIYAGHIYFLIKAVIITIILLIIVKILSKILIKKDYGFICNDGDIYLNFAYFMNKIKCNISDNKLALKIIEYLITYEKLYINVTIKEILFLLFIFRTIFVYFAYFDTLPLLNIKGF